MTATTTSAPNLMNREALRFLATCPGPFITAVVPDRHPGAPEGSRQLVIQRLIKTARERLAASPFADGALDLLAPLEELAADPALSAGGTGLAIFASPNSIVSYRVPARAEKLVIGKHAYLTPFLAEAYLANDVFILGLSTKQLRLFRYCHGECFELDLPQGVPASLEDAGRPDKTDLNRENRSSVGSSTGNLHALSFGTLTDREAAGEHLRHFFGLADRGLKSTLVGAPLLLMGVHEEIQAYRRASHYDHLLPTAVDGGPGFVTAAQVGALAKKAARADYDQRADAVLAEFREMKERSRTLTGLDAVLQAATQGRIHRLCVPLDAGQDLLNAAVVETLRTGGDVYEMAQDRLAATEPVAAILRY